MFVVVVVVVVVAVVIVALTLRSVKNQGASYVGFTEDLRR